MGPSATIVSQRRIPYERKDHVDELTLEVRTGRGLCEGESIRVYVRLRNGEAVLAGAEFNEDPSMSRSCIR